VYVFAPLTVKLELKPGQMAVGEDTTVKLGDVSVVIVRVFALDPVETQPLDPVPAIV
jgi:hypothetical protein